MKTKICIWATSIIVGICIITLGIIFYQTCFVHIGSVESAEARFIHCDVNKINQLRNEDIEVLKSILNCKFIFIENPSCGFSEDVSIKFDNQLTFCIACDTCPIIYIKEKNRYIQLSEQQKELLYSLLEPYGFYFPCV